jgi:ASC-1-like (ASCH) protein
MTYTKKIGGNLIEHQMKLQVVYQRKIAAGTKTVEGRLASRPTRAIAPGDTLNFNDGALICRVMRCVEYPSWEALIAAETPSALGFADAATALKTYQKIYWYGKDRRVMALGVQMVAARDTQMLLPLDQ